MASSATEQRSKNMRSIRSKNTKPELAVRRIVYGLGYRYRLHVRSLPGKPDIALSSRKKVIFVHGCFWHQHQHCAGGHLPTSRRCYWEPKLARNVERDQEHQEALRSLGWKTLTVWECELKSVKKVETRIKRFLS